MGTLKIIDFEENLRFSVILTKSLISSILMKSSILRSKNWEKSIAFLQMRPFWPHLSIFFENGKNYVFRIFYENPHFLRKWWKTTFFGFSSKIPIFTENGKKHGFLMILTKIMTFHPLGEMSKIFDFQWFLRKITDFIKIDEILNSSIEELREKHRFSTNGAILAPFVSFS